MVYPIRWDHPVDLFPCHLLWNLGFGAELWNEAKVGWQDWVSSCDVEVSVVEPQIDAECLGKQLGEVEIPEKSVSLFQVGLTWV